MSAFEALDAKIAALTQVDEAIRHTESLLFDASPGSEEHSRLAVLLATLRHARHTIAVHWVASTGIPQTPERKTTDLR